LRERIVPVVQALVALACVPALVALRPATWPAIPIREPVFRCLLWVVALCVIGLATRLARVGRRRLAHGLLGALAVASVGAYYNFGHFHFPYFVHHWEQFHYQLGSKYFPELGFDGLYVASLAAQKERSPQIAPQAKIRDLRSNNLVDSDDVEAHTAEVVARFDPDRWHRFAADNAYFVRTVPPGDLARIRSDHGYNPTPAWTFVARLWNGGELDRGRLVWLGLLDIGLLAIAFACVFRVYGARIGCLAVTIFGLGWAGRFEFIGGAFLRLDWLAATVVAVCMLRRDRPALAGALLGYAAAVRLFPVVFLFGPAIVALRALWSGQRPRWAMRLFAAFGTALAFAGAAGALTGHGTQAWRDFAARMDLYRLSVARNAVGLESLVLYGPEIVEHAVEDPRDTARWNIERRDWVERRHERSVWLRGAQALLLLFLAAAAWRATPADAVVLGVVALFAATHAANYYWAILLAIPLWRDGAATRGVLLVSFAMYVVARVEANTIVWHGLFSWALLLLFLAWLGPEALTTLRAGATPADDPKPA